MADLERQLVALRACIELPVTPDMATTVRARLAAEATPPARALRLPWGLAPRVALAGALAAFVVALGLTMAVSPSARSSILRWLGLQGAQITRVEKLPPTRAGVELSLGRHVSLAEARRRAGFRVALPGALPRPDEVHFAGGIPGGAVSLVYRPRAGLPAAGPSGVSLLLTEFSGSVGPYIRKMVVSGTRVRNVTIGTGPGYLITGPLHAVIFEDARREVREDRPRLAANTLLWERGSVTLRLEGKVSGRRLLEIARSVR